ncbi:c-type cytochrome [Aurantiacibacter odishensis]|uniref:c-type cytochrome n=1 Tax=Aurantiacibacter odishensis TaxID=1155476 RepID=UPI001F0C441E|nr:cytochrome c [Aurantiacibacter odishensis]
MHPRRGRLLAGLTGATLLSGVGMATGFSMSASAQATYEIEPRAPEYLYARTCGYCHGHNIAPIIRGRALPPAVTAAIVRSGMGAMPAFKPTEITDAELQALAEWLAQSEADPEEHGG